MTTKFISIKALATEAKDRGFDVRLSHDGSYAELHAPEHQGAKAVNWFGATYSTADIIISDRPGTGYGYNPFFYGPFHPGLCRSTDYGVQKLLSHPAMGELAA
jgi:hypothetical protein